MLHISECVS